MSLSITIEYKPAIVVRKGTTRAIAAALRTLVANPKDAEGNPGSFVVPAKFRGSVRLAAADVGVQVRTITEGEGVRVYLRDSDPDDTTPGLPGIE